MQKAVELRQEAAMAVVAQISDPGLGCSLVNSSSSMQESNLGPKFTGFVAPGLGQSPVAPGRPHGHRQ